MTYQEAMSVAEKALAARVNVGERLGYRMPMPYTILGAAECTFVMQQALDERAEGEWLVEALHPSDSSVKLPPESKARALLQCIMLVRLRPWSEVITVPMSSGYSEND